VVARIFWSSDAYTKSIVSDIDRKQYEVVANQSIGARLTQHWPLLLIILLVCPLLLFRLVQSPNSWYDEGLNINAAQTLVDTGTFGLTTSTGIRLADPAIQTGSPMLLLMGIVVKLFENNLLAIRMVMVVFGILTLISLYALAYRLYGRFAAFLVVLMLIAMPPSDTTSTFILLSRQFLGEIPAILCISLGFYLLTSDRPSLWTYVSVGILWGLAIIIKSQVFLILSATIAVWVLFRFITKKQDKFHWLLTAAVMGGLYGLDLLWRNTMAGPMLANNLAILREGITIHILPFRGLRNLSDWQTVFRFLISVIALSGLIFFVRRTAKPSPIFQQQTQSLRTTQSLMLVFVSIWMLWFTFISIGWTRYSFVGLIFACVILSGVVSAVWSNLKLPTNTLIYAGLIILTVALGYLVNISDINDSTGDDFWRMAEEIKTQIPVDARILSLDWATDNFVPQHFMYPPTHTINVITENAFVRSNNNLEFDSLAMCPQYILLGSLRLGSMVLETALNISDSKPLFQEGIYELYKINTDLLPASCRTNSKS
jgi:4-amino-4-deoxy-L-arabinose transferase-like glycosyltransferase